MSSFIPAVHAYSVIFFLSIRDFHSGFCQLPYAMENVTTSSATVPDGIRIGVCGLVGALYLSASIVTVTFNGLLLYVMFKDPLKCFRRPLSVYMTRLAMTDFLFGSVLDPPFSKNRILLCQLQRRGNNFLPHHPLFYR